MDFINSENVNLSFCCDEAFPLECRLLKEEKGISYIKISGIFPELTTPHPATVTVKIPLVNLHALWTPNMNADRAFTSNCKMFDSRISTGAPVMSFYDIDGNNGITIAYSDALNLVKLGGKVIEETCEFEFRLVLFDGLCDQLKQYEQVLRIDTRNVRYTKAIADVSAWWETYEIYRPITAPETAKFPMYSTWYSLHQNVTTENLLAQCKEAVDYSCKAIIIDDGWQTEDNARGYAYCGDWNVCKTKIADFKKLVEDIHEMGLKVILWYCVPLIGYKSQKWNELKSMLLSENYNNRSCGILDPRYSAVRSYIIETYVTAVKEWKLDGLKLDFIDCFRLYEESNQNQMPGMDFVSVADATDSMLKEVIARVQMVNPEIMIEFRQRYIGPAMRSYGNMFRVADCPVDPVTNKLRLGDIRLLSDKTIVHSDMTRWNSSDSDQSVAIALYHTLFSVLQISVDLTAISESQSKILKNFVEFTTRYQSVLIDGTLELAGAYAGYTNMYADNGTTQIHAIYHAIAVRVKAGFEKNIIVNATYQDTVLVKFEHSIASATIICKNLYGEIISREQRSIDAAFHEYYVGKAGVLEIYEN